MKKASIIYEMTKSIHHIVEGFMHKDQRLSESSHGGKYEKTR